MDTRSVELLEFHYILEKLKSMCIGAEGGKAICEQSFSIDRLSLDRMLEKVVYLKRLIESEISRPEIELPEISGGLSRIGVEGALLEGTQLVDIAGFIRGSQALESYVSSPIDDNKTSPFVAEGYDIPDLRDVSQFIFSHLETDGTVKESLPALRTIRSKMRRAQSDISAAANAYLRDRMSMWQANVPTQKDGRVVLPLKADYRGQVKGIIREVSTSGATIFIEPYDLIDKNNNYTLLESEYQLEAARVLRRCCENVRAHVEELRALRRHAAFVDTILARARFAASYNCYPAEAREKGFDIKGGRHPMLGEKVVPIEVELHDEQSVLIITGPNAGGKTVTLKTIGLFALMNQFGMCIPAAEGSSLQLYSEVLADIGDDQSIEDSLSTFSAHMKSISRFADQAAADTLILVDELGSGTDPEEGSAIAMAVLDRFIERGATVIATTHQSVLKNYGFSKPGVTNSSVSFDPETHLPTYTIVQGLPGESHALEIAQASGMNRGILAEARRYLDEQSTDVARIIREISAQQRSLNEREFEYEKKRGDLIERMRETDLRALRLKQRELELRTHGYMQLTQQIQESRKQLENLVKELREGELTKDKTRSVKQYLDTLQQTAERERAEIDEVKQELSPDFQIEPGLEVVVGGSRQRGKVVRKARKGYWIVATEKLKVTVPESEIKAIVKDGEKRTRVRIEHDSTAEHPVFTLDLRGYRLERALEELERQIDRAIMANMKSFEVIHGHGGGVLRNGVHERLRRHPAVQEYDFAVPEEGGFGKTIIRL